MPTAPSAFPLLGAPQAPGDKPNLPEGSKSLGGRLPEAVGNPQAPRHTLPEPRPDNTAGQSATQHLERSSSKSICHQNDRDWSPTDLCYCHIWQMEQLIMSGRLVIPKSMKGEGAVDPNKLTKKKEFQLWGKKLDNLPTLGRPQIMDSVVVL